MLQLTGWLWGLSDDDKFLSFLLVTDPKERVNLIVLIIPVCFKRESRNDMATSLHGFGECVLEQRPNGLHQELIREYALHVGQPFGAASLSRAKARRCMLSGSLPVPRGRNDSLVRKIPGAGCPIRNRWLCTQVTVSDRDLVSAIGYKPAGFFPLSLFTRNELQNLGQQSSGRADGFAAIDSLFSRPGAKIAAGLSQYYRKRSTVPCIHFRVEH